VDEPHSHKKNQIVQWVDGSMRDFPMQHCFWKPSCELQNSVSPFCTKHLQMRCFKKKKKHLNKSVLKNPLRVLKVKSDGFSKFLLWHGGCSKLNPIPECEDWKTKERILWNPLKLRMWHFGGAPFGPDTNGCQTQSHDATDDSDCAALRQKLQALWIVCKWKL